MYSTFNQNEILFASEDKKMKVLILDEIPEQGLIKLKDAGCEVTRGWDIPKEKLHKVIKPFDAIIVRSSTKVNRKLLSNAVKLKVIGRAGVGLDNIDLCEAKRRGIIVVNTPDAATSSVAELAFTFIMALTRDIVTGTEALRNGMWPKKRLRSFEVKGKTLGIIGYGRIGRELAKRALAFGMNVLANDINPLIEVQKGVVLVSLDEILEKSDYISLHVPYYEKTHHMISTKQFEKMRKGVNIIDCGRGRVMDLDALYEAIEAGIVRGAGLDVFPTEPPGQNKIFQLSNVLCTPHIGSETFEGQQRASIQIAEKIIHELNAWKQ